MELPKATTNKSLVKKGRPTVSPSWPHGEFTFKTLVDSNKGGLWQSSLRNKVKSALSSGKIKKVRSEKGTFGRPQDVYQNEDAQPSCGVPLHQQANQCHNQTQQESVGESMPLN